LALLIGLLGRRAEAHDPFEITTDAHIAGEQMSLHVAMSLRTAGQACLPRGDGGGRRVAAADFAALRADFTSCASSFYLITAGGQPLPVEEARVALTVERDLDMRVSYPRPRRGPLVFDAVYLSRLTNPNAGVVLTVTGERTFLGQTVLRPDDARLSIPLDAEAGAGGSTAAPTPSFRRYLALGVRHILTGYDHLLFLLALLIACQGLRAVLGVITCFTAAHSVTLALAGLGLLTPPGRIVEPLIAATIVFVAAENLARRPATRARGRAGLYASTFLFGLCHGFGFAAALKETGLGSGGSSLALPLIAFNLGVEAGQISVAGILLPVLWRLRAVPAFARHGERILSLSIGAVGVYWFLQRTVLARL
jgi:hypothetical protein